MRLRNTFVALAIGVLACGTESDVEDQSALPGEISAQYQYGYRISGTVSGAIVSGVTVRLSGARSATTTTSTSGYYSFGGLGNGSYVITPSAAGFTFTPSSRSVSISGANVSGRNFTAAASTVTHTISGTVSGAVLQGVTMTLSGTKSATATTDSSGRYAFSGLADGSYTVTPSRIGYSFTPTSQTVSLSGANVSGMNFTAFAVTGHSISGTVSGFVVMGVTMTLGGAKSATMTTDSAGRYAFTGLADGSYTVTASRAGFSFYPPSRTVLLSGADISGANFSAMQLGNTISGNVSGAVLQGVTMTLSGTKSATTKTDAAGFYIFTGLTVPGVYSVRPSLTGFVFNPTSRSVMLGRSGGVGGSGGVNPWAVSFTAGHPMTGSFAATGNMTNGRSYHTATLLADKKVLVAGGYGTAATLDSAELYDPATGTFTATGSMNVARGYHTATLLANGKVLIAGGYIGPTTYFSSAELYDPTTGTFTATGSMSVARYWHTATLLTNGKVLITGGHASGDTADSAELYDPATGTFSTTGSLAAMRMAHTATLLANGKVLIAGGESFMPGQPQGATAELYDPATGTFTPTGGMIVGHARHTATLLPNGRVLVTGGRTGPNLTARTPTAELYEPATGTFTATGSMSLAHEDHTASLLPDGAVLVAGGNTLYGYSYAAELYNPAAGTFTLGNMTTARYGHAATPLANGQVLLAGGLVSRTSAELYDP